MKGFTEDEYYQMERDIEDASSDWVTPISDKVDASDAGMLALKREAVNAYRAAERTCHRLDQLMQEIREEEILLAYHVEKQDVLRVAMKKLGDA